MGEPRFFFAAWPPTDVLSALRLRLAQFHQRNWPPAGRCELPQRWHLTLFYLGASDPTRLQRRLDDFWPGPFPITLSFDRIRAFKGGRVLWIGGQEAPPALTQWRQGWLAEDGVEADSFLPHVTLLRSPRPWSWEEKSIEPLYWTLQELTLVASSGGQYTVLRRWPMVS